MLACDGDAIAGTDPIRIMGHASSGLIQGLFYATVVVHYQATVDQELHFSAFERGSTLAAVGQHRQLLVMRGVLDVHRGRERVIIASNGLVDLQVPGRAVIEDAFHELATVGVREALASAFLTSAQIGGEFGNDFLADAVVDRHWADRPLELHDRGSITHTHDLASVVTELLVHFRKTTATYHRQVHLLLRSQASGHLLGGGGAHQISATGLVVHTVGVTQRLDVLQVGVASVLQSRSVANAWRAKALVVRKVLRHLRGQRLALGSGHIQSSDAL
mmetsp:Transcript_33628/g.57687  ORF Transcript_33628/g.57687 Transcript_33628/m.57687 type:complete len:275 (-) Transcript_33628:794-1618(-)